MKNNIEYIYYNTHILGKISDQKCLPFDNQEKQEWLNKLQKQVIKSDFLRKIFSLVIGCFMLLIALTLAILMAVKIVTLGSSQWYNYTFVIVGLVMLWVILYYVFGLIFYKRLKFQIHFKNSKSNQIDSCVHYASSNYFKFVQQYQKYIGESEFYIIKKNKKILLPFGLRVPKTFKNLIFNGHIIANIPYFYLSNKDQKFIFLPGMLILVDGKHSKVIASENINIKILDNHYYLYNQDELLLEFICQGKFNLNFFYFKYEQC